MVATLFAPFSPIIPFKSPKSSKIAHFIEESGDFVHWRFLQIYWRFMYLLTKAEIVNKFMKKCLGRISCSVTFVEKECFPPPCHSEYSCHSAFASCHSEERSDEESREHKEKGNTEKDETWMLPRFFASLWMTIINNRIKNKWWKQPPHTARWLLAGTRKFLQEMWRNIW